MQYSCPEASEESTNSASMTENENKLHKCSLSKIQKSYIKKRHKTEGS